VCLEIRLGQGWSGSLVVTMATRPFEPVAAVGGSVRPAIVVRSASLGRGVLVVVVILFFCVVFNRCCMGCTRCNNVECLGASDARCC
jgi:hypothetical protein